MGTSLAATCPYVAPHERDRGRTVGSGVILELRGDWEAFPIEVVQQPGHGAAIAQVGEGDLGPTSQTRFRGKGLDKGEQRRRGLVQVLEARVSGL